MNQIEKHKKYINGKLKPTHRSLEIRKIAKMPDGIKYLTWSIGWEAETDYSYEIECKNNKGEQVTVYCHIVTFLSLFKLRSLFFRQSSEEYERMYP